MLGASVTPRRRPAAKAAAPSGGSAAAPASPSPGAHAGAPAQHGSGTGKPEAQGTLQGTVVDSEAVLQVVSAQAGIPVGQLRGDPTWFAELRDGLLATVLGQSAAVRCDLRDATCMG